jgi:hypothetical protein
MRESLCRGEIDVEINCPCVRRHELSRSDGEVVHNEDADKNREDYPPSLEQSLSAHGAHGREGYSAEEAQPMVMGAAAIMLIVTLFSARRVDGSTLGVPLIRRGAYVSGRARADDDGITRG